MKWNNLALSSVAILLILSLAGYPASAQPMQTAGFTVSNVQWGAPSAPVEAGPGEQSVPLTVTLQYYFQNTAQSLQVTLSLPPGFTDTNGLSSVTSYVSGSVPSGTVFSLTFMLDIGPDVTTGTYTFPLTMTWSAVTSYYPLTSVAEVQTSALSVQLKGKVQLQFSAPQSVLTPGAVTDVPILVSNTGTGLASNISLSISVTPPTVAAPTTVSILNRNVLSQIGALGANSSAERSVDVYAPFALAGTSVSLAVTATYVDAYGNTRSTASSVGLYVRGSAVAPIAVTARSLLLAPGEINNATLIVTNDGSQTLRQLQIAVAVPPSVSLLGQFPVTVPILQGGAQIQVSMPLFISAQLSGSPISTVVTISYTDATGNAGSMTQNVGFYVSVLTASPVTMKAQPSALTPGALNNVTLTITNGGQQALAQLKINVDVPPSISTLSQFPITLSNLQPGASVQQTISLFVPSVLSGSPVTIPATVSYTDAAGNTGVLTQNLGFYVPLLTAVPVTIGAQPSSLTPGDLNNVTLTVTNMGEQTLAQVEISITVPPSISVLSRFPVTLSNLQAGSSAQVKMPLFVSSQLSGSPTTIPVILTYTGIEGNQGVLTQNLGFYVPISKSPNLGLSGYSYNPTLVYPGTTVASLQVVLVNSGTTSASNVNVTLVPSNPVYSISNGSLTRSLGLFPVGQSIPLTFMIGIRNSSAPVNSTLTLAVQSVGTKPLQFSIPFTEQPKADLQIVGVSAPSISGGDGADQVTFTVRNVGHATAQFTTFDMQPSNAFLPSTQGNFNSGTSAAVGTLAPGQRANVTVVLQVNSNVQPGSYPLVFNAGWTQLGTDQQFAQQMSFALDVHASGFQSLNSEVLSVPGLAVIAVIIIALIALLVRRARARRVG